jgi:hypothetical protein
MNSQLPFLLQQAPLTTKEINEIKSFQENITEEQKK